MAKSTLLRGALIFTALSVVAKILGALYKIPLSSLIGAQGVGLYQSVFPTYGFAVSLTSGGLTTAIAGVIASKSDGHVFTAKNLLFPCLAVFCSFSLLPTILIAVFCHGIASLQGNAVLSAGYLVVAPAVVISTASAVCRGYFQGKQSFVPSAISQITEQAVKLGVSLPLCLIFAKNNPYLGFLLALVGVTASEIVTLLGFIPFILAENRTQSALSHIDARKTLGLIIKRALPVTASGLILPLTQFIDSATVVRILSLSSPIEEATANYGLITGVVGTVLSLPTSVTCALFSVFLPKISSAENDKLKLEGFFSLALRFFSVGGLLVSCALFTFASPIVSFLFGSALTEAQLKTAISLMKVGSVTVFYNCLLHACSAGVLGIGKPLIHTAVLAISGALKSLTVVILTFAIGVNGAMIGFVVFYAVASCVESFIILFKLKLRPDLTFAVKCVASSACFTLVATTLSALSPFSSFLGAIFAGIIALLFYGATFLAFTFIGQIRFRKKTA